MPVWCFTLALPGVPAIRRSCVSGQPASSPNRASVSGVRGDVRGGRPATPDGSSGLEAIAQRVLSPLILGRPHVIEPADQAPTTVWVHKSALVAMLVSSDEARADGYGVASITTSAKRGRTATRCPAPSAGSPATKAPGWPPHASYRSPWSWTTVVSLIVLGATS